VNFKVTVYIQGVQESAVNFNDGYQYIVRDANQMFCNVAEMFPRIQANK